MIVAFAGPSLPEGQRDRFIGVDWRPPAQAGDLLRLRPAASLTICLIDGYFDHRPAVRHKEILYHLAGGTRLLGAGSIGALRAAEMDEFGMIGVGQIYRAYKRGSIVADDEVALVHAGPELGWRAVSVPLVDVRATLCGAVRERVLRPAAARTLLCAAARIHYVDRDWPAILTKCDPGLAERVQANAVEQKRIDAVACLQAALHSAPEPHPEAPAFEPTVFVDALARELGISLDPARI